MPIRGAFGNGSMRTFGVDIGAKKVFGSNVAVQYLIVAGGGGSHGSYNPASGTGSGGGGGAGGLRTGTTNTSAGARLFVAVGAGGTGYTNGTNSSVTVANDGIGGGVWSNLICDGGGAGGYAYNSPGTTNFNALPGGSGGGGQGLYLNNSPGAAGYAPIGNNGGSGRGPAGVASASGGGGGAGGAGGPGVDAPNNLIGGAGGAALASSITGTPVNYAGGGAGAGQAGGPASGTQGTTAAPGGAVNSSAPANGGGGAGGTVVGQDTVYSGGSGIVILRSATRASNTIGSPTETTVSGDYVYTFTGTGQIVFGTP